MTSSVSHARRTAAALVTIAALTTLSGCGSSRTPQKFCSVMAEHKQRYLAAMQTANDSISSNSDGGLLLGTAEAVAALGDLQRMWEELAKVAPDEIQTDVEAIRDANAKQLDAAKDAIKDPLGSLAGSLVQGLSVSGSYQRVDAYTKEHCS